LAKRSLVFSGIETTFNTRANATSMLTMSRSCVQAVYHDNLKHSTTWWQSWKLTLERSLALVRLMAFELYLWVVSTAVVKALRERFTRKSSVRL